jgi:hypothetical protein
MEERIRTLEILVAILLARIEELEYNTQNIKVE